MPVVSNAMTTQCARPVRTARVPALRHRSRALAHHRRARIVARAAAASFDEATALQLPYDDRQAVLSAMESCEYCATAAEVAGLTGLTIDEAARVLQWLTYETKGSMRVRTRARNALRVEGSRDHLRKP